MDTTIVLLLGGLAILAVAATLYAINRSWGDFGRAGRMPRAGASAPGESRRRNMLMDLMDELAQPKPGASPIGAQPPIAQAPILHPLVRRAAEEALRKGGPPARYIVRQGDQLYFDFSQIDDPARRQQAYDLMQRFNTGQDVDLNAMLRLVREMFQP